MSNRKIETGPTTATVIGNIRNIRDGKRLSLADVSMRLRELGRPLSVSSLSDMETGKRKVDVDDLVVIAVALDVSPIALLMPGVPGGEEYVTATGVPEDEAIIFWDWLRAEYPLTEVQDWPAEQRPGASRMLEFLRYSRPPWTLGGLDDVDLARMVRGGIPRAKGQN